MTATSTIDRSANGRARTTVLMVGAGAIVALIAATIDAYSALAVGADPSFAALRPAIYGPFVIIGVVAAYLGWTIIRRRSARPGSVLRVLVPLLTVLSFVPDVILAVTAFIPGANLTGVIALAIMHLIVVAVAVPLCLRLAPVR